MIGAAVGPISGTSPDECAVCDSTQVPPKLHSYENTSPSRSRATEDDGETESSGDSNARGLSETHSGPKGLTVNSAPMHFFIFSHSLKIIAVEMEVTSFVCYP